MRKVLALGALTMLSAGLAVSPANGTSPGEVTDVPHGMWFDPEARALRADALERDVELAAQRAGTSPGPLLERVDAELRAGALADRLSAQLGDRFLGLRWGNGMVLSALVADAVPESLALDGVVVNQEVVGVTNREVGALQDRLSALLSRKTNDFSVATDVSEMTTYVTVSGPADAEVIDDLRREVGALQPTWQLKIDILQGPVSSPWTTYGGAELRLPGPQFWCTSGFSVFQGSTTGVSTAGHCGSGMTTYRDWFNAVNHTITYRSGHVGSWGDFEWYTSNGVEADDFYHTNAGARFDVLAVINSFSVNQQLWWYGRGTKGEYDGTVMFTNVSAGGRGRLVCMADSQGGPGDSGGPVYGGNYVAGLIMGGVVINGIERMCFSQARYIDDAIGVSIKTS